MEPMCGLEEARVGLIQHERDRPSRKVIQSKRPSTIFKVPPDLSGAQKSAFEWKIISTGAYYDPLPGDEEKARYMWDIKMRHFINLLKGDEMDEEIGPQQQPPWKRHLINLFKDYEIEEENGSQQQPPWKRYLINLFKDYEIEGEIGPQQQPPRKRHLKDLFKDYEIKEEIGPQQQTLICLYKAIEGLEPGARENYSNPPNFASEDFNFTMVIDGCFMIDLLRLCTKICKDHVCKGKELRPSDSDSPVWKTRWLLPSLKRDLIKLQNQIPFIVLEELWKKTSSSEPYELKELLMTFFQSMVIRMEPDKSMKWLGLDNLNCAHPLGLLRSFFIDSVFGKQEVKMTSRENLKLIYSAQDLHEAGVTLIKRINEKEENSSRNRVNCTLGLLQSFCIDSMFPNEKRKITTTSSENPYLLLYIEFDSKKRVLQIPPLSIDVDMTTLLLNFVAYEQCDESQKPYFTNYLLFLDSLINNEEDLTILQKKGIIRYPLGTEKEVINLFNNFCKEMLYDFDQAYFLVDMEAINKYCDEFYNNNWRLWWSNLKKERFSSPWTCLSLIAAIVLLILTLLQTIYTMVSYHHPN